MNHVLLWANLGSRLTRCQRQLAPLLQRNLSHLHRQHARDEERSAEPLPIDFSVDLSRRFVNAKIRKQARKPLVADAAVLHFSLNQLLGSLLPGLVRPSTLIWQSIHRLSSHFSLQSLVATGLFFTAILGRIRLISECMNYTSTEQIFCGDRLLRNQSTDVVDYQLPRAGGLR